MLRRRLTDTEIRVLQLVARGYTDEAIGEELGVARNTARKHMTNVLNKLGVHSRAHAVSLCLCEGIIEC